MSEERRTGERRAAIDEAVNDTAPEVERMMRDFWRQAPAWRKLRQVSMLNEMLDSLILANIKKRYPEADAAEIRRRFARRKLPPDLYRKYFETDEEDMSEERDG